MAFVYSVAQITQPDVTSKPVDLQLLDNGQGADLTAGDGIYSRYFFDYSSVGRYTVKVQVQNSNTSLISNGFIASRRRRRGVAAPARFYRERQYRSEVGDRDWCCGSVIPIDPEYATETGEFWRSASAGSFKVTEVLPAGDFLPPGQVKDLRAKSENVETINLFWTAPGDDLDQGKVSSYIICITRDKTQLQEDSFGTYMNEILLAALNDSNFEIGEAMSHASFTANLDTELQKNTAYFFALQAYDDEGNKSPVSNIARLTINASQALEGLSSWMSALVIGLAVAVNDIGLKV